MRRLIFFLAFLGMLAAQSSENLFKSGRCSLCREMTSALNSQMNGIIFVEALSLLLGGDTMTATWALDSLRQLIVTPDYMCGKVLNLCGGLQYQEIDEYEAVQEILKDKPFKLVDNDYMDLLYVEMRTHIKERKTLKFIHIADTHADLWYQEGAIADCQNGYCCRNDTFTGRGIIPAGKFGTLDGPCDIPYITLQNALEYMKDTIQPDAIFWTGDNSPHDGYRQAQWTQQSALSTNMTAHMIQEVFSDKLERTFAAFGNHDIYPHWDFSQFGNPSATQSAPYWKAWLDADNYENFTKTGYYSQQMRFIEDKMVKVIALNTESCDVTNPYTFGQLSDLNGQIEFLLNELKFVEENNGLAIIIGHITPDDGCHHEFAVRYRAILERYQHVIRLNMFAHTHSDIYKLGMSFGDQQEPVGSLSICGSVTTWGGNPTFCVYEVDEETLLPVQKYTYAFDLQKANREGFISWELFTNWTDIYQLEDLSPNSLYQLSNRYLNDSSLSTRYQTHRNRRYQDDVCDTQSCQISLQCDAITFDPLERAKCIGYAPYDFKNNFFGSLLQVLQGPWVKQLSDGILPIAKILNRG